MQLYHHPYSLDSQKVRLALEERGIDYTSFRVNPLKARDMDRSFFKMNPSAKLPVFKNGEHIIYNTIEIIQYIERIMVSPESFDIINKGKSLDWMRKIDHWNPKIFTLSHVPNKYRLFVSKFIRKVIIARMAESPDLASLYHVKLRAAYETEEILKDPVFVKQSEEELCSLLDHAEEQLKETPYLAGEEFSMADVVFIPVLARIALLSLEEQYITCRPMVAGYWKKVKLRPSYFAVIGKYFSGWRRYKMFLNTITAVWIRNSLRRY